MIVVLDHEKAAMVTSSSPIKLMDGGKARLLRLARSHQVLISGRRA